MPASRVGSQASGLLDSVAVRSVAVQNDKITAIRERLDIVQVVGSYVQLKKKGQRYVGLCPFHSEKTPSFSVSPDRGLFYCFGCHEGGDAFAFVMKHDGVDFREAARRLGAKVGIELAPESPADRARRQAEERIIAANTQAHLFFQQALRTRAGQRARSYLAGRGVNEALAREWRLGFGGAPGEMLAFLDQKGVPRENAVQAGLLTEDGERGLFDGRVIFPVLDLLRRLVGFGGRRLGDGNAPKYVNTRESPMFAKRRLLYGWEHAEETVRRTRRVVLVEGYMDVIACHTAGLTQAVAALGTAFTDDHAAHCARLAREVVVLLDGDAPGQAAAFKAALRLLPHKLATLVAWLPEGLDPDGCLRQKGAEALTQVVGEAKPAIEHFLTHLFAQATAAGTIEARAQAARELWPLIQALGAGLEKDLYTARLAEKVGVSVEQLTRHLHPAPAPRPTTAASGGTQGKAAGGASEANRAAGRERQGRVVAGASTAAGTAATRSGRGGDASTGEDSLADASSTASAPPPVAPPPKPVLDKVEYAMLRELLLYPELRPRLEALVEYAVSPPMQAMLDELARTDASAGEIINRHLAGDRRSVALVRIQPAKCDDNAAERAEKTYNDVLARMKSRHVDAALRDVIRELSEREAKGGETGDLIRRQQDLSRRKQALLHARHSG